MNLRPIERIVVAELLIALWIAASASMAQRTDAVRQPTDYANGQQRKSFRHTLTRSVAMNYLGDPT